MFKFAHIFLLSFTCLIAEQPYTPKQTHAVKEPWRWTNIEFESHKDPQTITTASDSSVWIGFQDGSIQRHSNEGVEDMMTKNSTVIMHLFANSTNNIFLVNEYGLYSKTKTEWTQINDITSLKATVNPIQEFSDGSLWYCHNNGISQFTKDSEVSRINFPDGIVSVCEVSPDKVWVMTRANHKIFEVERTQTGLSDPEKWKPIMTLISDYLPGDIFGTGMMFKDSKGYIWIGNNSLGQGMIRYDLKTGNKKTFNLFNLGGDNHNIDISETNDGKIVATGRRFIHLWDGKNWEILNQTDNIPTSTKLVFKQSKDGFVYLLETGNRVTRIDYSNKNWESYNELIFQCNSQKNRNWYLSYQGKVIEEIRDEPRWIHHNDKNIIKNVIGIRTTDNGDVFCIGNEDGQAALSIFDDGEWNKMLFPNYANTFECQSFYQQKDGSILISCPKNLTPEIDTQSYGILKLTKKNKSYTSEQFLPKKSPIGALNLSQTEDGYYWANRLRIHRFSENSKIEKFEPPSWNAHWIDKMIITSDNNIWISAWALGVFRLDDQMEWTHFGIEKGLPTTFTLDLLQQKNGSLLTATEDGLFRFDGQMWYPILDEKFGMKRDSGKIIEDQNGWLWINNMSNGWHSRSTEIDVSQSRYKDGFYTICFKSDKNAPNTIIQGSDSLAISTSECDLIWTASDAWSKTPKKKLHYSYRLDDATWSPFSRETNVQLTGLKDGTHLLEVKSRDEDFNIDPSPAKIEIHVTLPFWMQEWFYILTGTILLGFVTLITIIVRQKFKHINEMDELRNRFFMNLSHELRTPLSLIMIPLERLRKQDLGNEANRDLKTMNSSCNRMILLIEQLLDFRSVEKGKLKIRTENIDIVLFLKELVSALEIQAESKKQNILFASTHDLFKAEIDPDLIQKISENLISNAIKYTPLHGQISIQLHIQEQSNDDAPYLMIITIEDNGFGIKQELKDKIFEPFYRDNTDLPTQGYGIGLALVKEIVDKLNGSVQFESPIFKDDIQQPGTRFIVQLPIDKPSEFISTDGTSQTSLDQKPNDSSEEDLKQIASTTKNSKPTILIVEDNDELRYHLSEELKQEFNIVEARDGNDGIKKAEKSMPDLIISDVLMPNQDGYEFTKQVKTNQNLAHIPVILLTALKSKQHENEGIEAGADDFLNKPISLELLHKKIHNQLQTRSYLRERMKLKYHANGIDEEITNHCDQFMQRSLEVVNAHIDNPELNMDLFAREMGMSRSCFYKKFESVSGVSPASFIKSQRLKEAARLILIGNQSLTDIALDVGFTKLSNFSRAFKEFYHCTPSKYKEIQQGKNTEKY